MLSRKEHPRLGTPLPQEWKETVTLSLNSAYVEECKKHQKEFDVWGFVFESELLVLVSFLDKNNSNSIPITCAVSFEVEDDKKIDKVLPKMLDVCCLVFERIFDENDSDVYLPVWNETEYKKWKFFLQVTRENVAVFLQAEELLREGL